MKRFFRLRQWIGYLASVLVSVFVVAGLVLAATTINNNISTDGTLSVSSTASITGLGTFSGGILVNNSTSTITNLVTLNSTSTAATTTSFYISGGFQANGASSTIVNLMTFNASSTNATTTQFAMTNGGTAILSITPDSASTTGTIIRHGGAATSTIVNSYINAFSIATGTVATPVFTIDSTAGGRVGIGTSSPTQTLSISSQSSTATTSISLDSSSNKSCIQLKSATGTPYRLYINASSIGNTGGLVVEPGTCF